MKKHLCIYCCFCLIFSLIFPMSVSAEKDRMRDLPILSPRYDTDAFCFTFENESDFLHPDVTIAHSADNTAENPMYTPGAGNSNAALHIRQDCTVYPNGILNSGINNVTLYPGKTYRISAWVKILSNDIYKIEPNFNFIFLNNGTQLYEDEACTAPSSASGVFEIVTAKGSDIGFRKSDGTITDEWRRLEVLYTVDNTFNNYFIRPQNPLSTRVWLRVGSSAHGINIPTDYTDAFLDSIRVPVTDETTGNVTYEIDATKYYTEYLVDDWSIEPYTKPLQALQPNNTYNDFESSNWYNASDVKWSVSYSSATVTTERPSAAHTSTNHALAITYTGCPYSYADFSAQLSDSHSLIPNRAYKISFWLKGSEAAVKYYEGKQRYLKLIPERHYEDRLERTKHKWAETPLNDTLTEEWQKLEYIWYEPSPHALGRNSANNTDVRFDLRFYSLPKSDSVITEAINGSDVTYIYSYLNHAGETVYADFKDFVFYIDDFSIEPMDIVLNGDFAYDSAANTPSSAWDITHYPAGQNEHIPALFGTGAIESDNTLPAGKHALVLKRGEERPGQKVEIDSRKHYKISFWAKADSVESIGTAIAPVLDRSVTGNVRDNTVTSINPEGCYGYGNTTGEIGDIPLYLYSGAMPNKNHNYLKLEPYDNETVVYDDYFARLKSCNGYENQTVPTAWNYQYYNGKEWISQNHDLVESNWTLSAEWKKYECFYYWDYEGEHYRLPRLCIATDKDADFRLADIRVESYNDSSEPLHVENVLFGRGQQNFYVGNDLHLTYDFVPQNPALKEGNSIFKLLTGTADGTYAVSYMTHCRGDANIAVSVPDIPFGNRLGLEIIPVDADGSVGTPYRVHLDGFIAGKVNSELAIKDTSAVFSVSSSFAREYENQSVSAFLSLYDAENRLIKASLYPITAAAPETITQSVPLNGAKKAKLMVLENTENFTPCCDTKSVLYFPENQTPFGDADTITVAYMGGSSMAGKGIYNPDESTYCTYITDYFKNAYPNKEILTRNYAKDGADTAYGLTIAEQVVAESPDIIFLDYALDDNGFDVRQNLTNLVQLLTSGEKVPYIIFLYTTNRSYADYAKYHREIAEKFFIPQMNLRTPLKEHLNGSDAKKEGYLTDDFHPSGEGHIIYGAHIIQILKSGICYSYPKLR